MSVMFPEALPCNCTCHTMPGVMHVAACCNAPPWRKAETEPPYLHNPWDYQCLRRCLGEPSAPDARCNTCRAVMDKAINRDNDSLEELIALKDNIITTALDLVATERYFDRLTIPTSSDSMALDAAHDDFDAALKKYLKARIAFALAHHEEIP